MRIWKAPTAVFLLLMSKTVVGQEFWQGTRYGMTPAEVIALLPAATMVPLDQRALSDGSDALVQIESVIYLKRSFKALFRFRSERLDGVNLSSSSKPVDAEKDWAEFFDAMRGQYGREVDSTRRPDRYVDATWNVGRTDINVSRFIADDGAETVEVGFRAAPDGLYDSDVVWVSSEFYMFFFSACDEEEVFCEQVSLRLIRRDDCTDFRPQLGASIRRCMGSDIPCEHLGYFFSAGGVNYHLNELLTKLDRDGQDPEKITREKAPVKFQRTDQACLPVTQ